MRSPDARAARALVSARPHERFHAKAQVSPDHRSDAICKDAGSARKAMPVQDRERDRPALLDPVEIR